MTRSTLIIILIGTFVTLIVGTYQQITRQGPKVVFCDVGQGSATYIRTPSGDDIIIDAGPATSKIVRCLEEHMPYFDRTIELALITHDQKDHTGGITELSKYQFTISKQFLNTQFTKNKIIRAGGVLIRSLFPDDSCVHTDKNACSGIYVVYFSPQWCILITGDTDAYTLENALKSTGVSCPLLLVPHHGSKTGLSPLALELAHPTATVISAGKNNNYGHPHPSIIELLKAHNIQIRRTDEEGSVEYKLSKIQIF